MKNRILFIDRDGTLINEPEDEQIDSLEKLEFLPEVISSLSRLKHVFELVMVTNQDGLGTDSFPEDTFWPAHNKMMQLLENEKITFSSVHIDKSFPQDNSPNRKPGTGMLTEYISDNYDLANSFVIGDRLSDVELAKNLGCRGILIQSNGLPEVTPELHEFCALSTETWGELTSYLLNDTRKAKVSRKTNETDINIEINLDGTGKSDIDTGLSFFNHMLEQIAKHGSIDLKVITKGDLEVDEHHTIEDTAIALGEAFSKALGNKKGIYRYGFLLPMDESLAQVAIDFGGRNWIVWDADFSREKVGDMPTEMFFHFFKSFSDSAKCNLNIKVEGDNEHHKIESIFKGFAKAIKMAVNIDDTNPDNLPSTKGVL